MSTAKQAQKHTGLVMALALAVSSLGHAQGQLDTLVADRAAAIEDKVIAWRRDIHQHPELSNREFRTAALVADHLRSLGLEVETEIAYTGVVATLVGGRPGPASRHGCLAGGGAD